VLDGVRWNDPASGVDAKVTHLRVDLKPLALLAKQVRITTLDVSGIDVALTTLPPKPEPPSAPFSLQAPIDIALDQLAVRDAKIAQDGKPVFALDSLDASAAWTRLGAVVKSLALRAPDGQVDLHGTIGAASGYPGDGETTFRWKVGDVEYAGNLKARGDGKRATLALELDTPTKATIDATLTQTSALPWTAKITVRRFDPKLVQKDSTLASLALALEGSGDKNAGAINGDVAVNDHHVQIDPLRYALDGQTLKFETLTLKSPEAAGSLTASGAVQLDAKPVSANALVEWQGVEIPADLAGQLLATHGKLNAAGSAEKFHADGALSIGPPGQLADLALDVDGTQELISIKQLALKQAQGGLDAHGEVKLKPALGWDIAAKASKLDPGAFAKAWPGALDFDLATQGTQTGDGPDATIKLDKLGGTLRKKPVSGQADLRVKPGHVVDGTLNLASGKSRVDVTGAGGKDTDATIKLAIASLGDWLPDSGGRLDGQFRVHGKWPALAVDGRAHGAQIANGTTHLDTLDVDAAIASIDPRRASSRSRRPSSPPAASSSTRST
jgi:translocation and assembly module TamB